jgi:hypothetical protein
MEVQPRRKHWKDAYVLRLRGSRAVEWMRALRPSLGARRQGQIDRALACYDPRSSYKLTPEDVRAALADLAAGVSVASVADRFSVSVWCIYDLRLGRTHREIERI